uniref:Uncharacterized protein n=1 Tax=Cyanistes caeruleus TaxID=156563 RepID=A0A8C0TYJ7_CYACU
NWLYLKVNYPDICTLRENSASLINFFQWNYASSSDINSCFVGKYRFGGLPCTERSGTSLTTFWIFPLPRLRNK